MKNIMIDKSENCKDFIPLFSGEEECSPHHSFGPYVREHYIIHFCLSGSGLLHDKYGEHRISAGDLFIIREGESTVYTADEFDPWHYIWIATVGRCADEFDGLPSVISSASGLFEKIKRTIDENETRPEIYCSYLYELLYLAGNKNPDERGNLPSKVKRYIKYNYMLDINVESISNLFGFERSYLYRVFKKHYGIGVKEYLVNIRMEKARALLPVENSVRRVASLVGYSDEFAFSKAFKRQFGLSPIEFKRSSLL